MKINFDLNPDHFSEILENFWKLSGDKIKLIDREYDPANGSPVFTVEGKYSTRGWTEWTQGFQYGSAILQFDAANDPWFLNYGKENTLNLMAPIVLMAVIGKRRPPKAVILISSMALVTYLLSLAGVVPDHVGTLRLDLFLYLFLIVSALLISLRRKL